MQKKKLSQVIFTNRLLMKWLFIKHLPPTIKLILTMSSFNDWVYSGIFWSCCCNRFAKTVMYQRLLLQIRDFLDSKHIHKDRSLGYKQIFTPCQQYEKSCKRIVKLWIFPEIICERYCNSYNPVNELSMDEQMTGTKSWISFIYMPKKTKKFGINRILHSVSKLYK